MDLSKLRVPLEDSQSHEHLLRFHGFEKMSIDGMSNPVLRKYIILTYHRFSPFVSDYESIRERKNQVLKYLGYKDSDITEEMKQVLMSVHRDVGMMAVRFCRFENNIAYQTLCATQEAHASLLVTMSAELGATKEAKDITDITIKIEKIVDSITALSEKIFQKDIELTNFVFSLQEIERLNIFPEDYARLNAV